MSLSLILIIYNLLLPVFVIVAFPAWVLKMWKRGGYGTGLMQRLGRFKTSPEDEPKGVVYIHAVSVGEVNIALKLIDQWHASYPEEKIVLATTTATGHEIARSKASDTLRIIYSPLDFSFIVRSVFKRFQPKQIILVEAEVWPNFTSIAHRQQIPQSVVNARLSARSEARYLKFAPMVQPLFAMLDRILTQNEQDTKRYAGLDIVREKIHTVGSIKFDMSIAMSAPRKREEFQKIIDSFGVDKKVVIAVSTHAGEEKLIAEEFLNLAEQRDKLLILVPRHAERRAEVSAELKSLGIDVVLRSDSGVAVPSEKSCLVIDTTGELRDWTAHADVAIIGKSFLGRGGQNPVEAITAGVPVICGRHMGNFEPLVTSLKQANSIVSLDSSSDLAVALQNLLSNDEKVAEMTSTAKNLLSDHEGAVVRTVELLHL